MRNSKVCTVKVFDNSPFERATSALVYRIVTANGEESVLKHTYHLDTRQLDRLSGRLNTMNTRGAVTVRPWLGGGLGYVVER